MQRVKREPNDVSYYMRRYTGRLSYVSSCLFILFLLSNAILFCQGSLKAEFYSGKNFEKYISTKSMERIDLYWEQTAPVANMDPQKCSIRWTGSIKPPVSGEYRFSAKVDYGLRLWINGELIIDDWTLHDWGRLDGRIELNENELYDFKVEYFNAMFGGEIRLMWDLPIIGNSNNLSAKAAIIDAKYFFPSQDLPTDVVSISSVNPVASPDPNPPPNTTKKVKQRKQKTEPINASVFSSQNLVDNSKRGTQETPKAIARAKMSKDIIEAFKPKSVQFERAQAVILEDSFADLDLLANFLLLNTYLFTQIEGHTDLAGDPDKNMKLSERRAYAVARYLIKKGVSATQIEAKGMGGTQPLIRGGDKRYHPENRRVSFVIKVL